jgi:hypothetical protein
LLNSTGCTILLALAWLQHVRGAFTTNYQLLTKQYTAISSENLVGILLV